MIVLSNLSRYSSQASLKILQSLNIFCPLLYLIFLHVVAFTLNLPSPYMLQIIPSLYCRTHFKSDFLQTLFFQLLLLKKNKSLFEIPLSHVDTSFMVMTVPFKSQVFVLFKPPLTQSMHELYR